MLHACEITNEVFWNFHPECDKDVRRMLEEFVDEATEFQRILEDDRGLSEKTLAVHLHNFGTLLYTYCRRALF